MTDQERKNPTATTTEHELLDAVNSQTEALREIAAAMLDVQRQLAELPYRTAAAVSATRGASSANEVIRRTENGAASLLGARSRLSGGAS